MGWYPKYIKKSCKSIKNTHNPIEKVAKSCKGTSQKRNHKQQVDACNYAQPQDLSEK